MSVVWLVAALCWGGLPVAVPNKFVPSGPEGQRWWGATGDRLKANLAALLKTDEEALLAPYEKRPGAEARSGEAVGQFLEAAAGAYGYQKEQRLRVLTERVAKRLLATQLPDGYLGTYREADRWTSWDVATHQSNLRGLLAYWSMSHDERAFAAAKRIGELLIATFGPDKRDIVAASAESGWAGTGVLGGMCMLYTVTGDQRFLAFARYVASVREPQLEALVNEGKVAASAEHVVPTLIGFLELYRFTGDERLWSAVQSAHEGMAGQPGLAELNWHMLRLTGEARYAGDLETAPPALLPWLVAGNLGNGVAIEHYPEGTFLVHGPVGKPLRFELARAKSDAGEVIRVTLVEGEGRFPLWLRMTKAASVRVGDKTYNGRAGRYVLIDRKWSTGDRAEWLR